ncbi:hypothetical protein JCM10213_003296 [Rhodosporidiobolus nylandii]
MPHGAKKVVRKQKKAFPLLRLPPALLTRIFSYEDVMAPNTVALCKALLPYTLAGLHAEVALSAPAQFRQFRQSLSQHPPLSKALVALTVECGSPSLTQGPRIELEKGDSPAIEEDGFSDNACILSLHLSPLQRLLLRLPELTYLSLSSASAVSSVLDERFWQYEPLRQVKTLALALATEEDWGMLEAAACCRILLEFLPSLRSLTFTRNLYDMPLHLLNLSPAVHLPPRSWHLQHFEMLGAMVGPETRNLFTSWTPTLTNLRLLIVDPPYADFMTDLVRLPPSIEHLALSFGFLCPQGPSVLPGPKLREGTTLYFPNLETLMLGGDIVSSATFAFIFATPSLVSIGFEPHVQLEADKLLAMVQDASVLPKLESLYIGICTCDGRESRFAPSRRPPWRRRPVWPRRFGYSDAKRLIETADKADIELEGNVLCGARCCDAGDGHKCPGWYK